MKPKLLKVLCGYIIFVVLLVATLKFKILVIDFGYVITSLAFFTGILFGIGWLHGLYMFYLGRKILGRLRVIDIDSYNAMNWKGSHAWIPWMFSQEHCEDEVIAPLKEKSKRLFKQAWLFVLASIIVFLTIPVVAYILFSLSF